MLFVRFFTLVLFVSGITLLSWNCQKSNDTPGGILAVGSWKVSYYFDRTNKTALYSAYVFDFKTGGQLTVSDGSQSWNGSWSTACDDSRPKLCLTISAAAPSVLRELAEDWLIVTLNDTFMHLEHRSGGGGDTEILHFARL